MSANPTPTSIRCRVEVLPSARINLAEGMRTRDPKSWQARALILRQRRRCYRDRLKPNTSFLAGIRLRFTAGAPVRSMATTMP